MKNQDIGNQREYFPPRSLPRHLLYAGKPVHRSGSPAPLPLPSLALKISFSATTDLRDNKPQAPKDY